MLVIDCERLSVQATCRAAAATHASIVIVSRNRRRELCNAVTSALSQDVPVEVIVVDDASTDGSAEMVRRRFPQVRVYRSAQPKGYIVQRNLAARLANSDVIVSIDDDATFLSPRTVRQTLAAFDHPRVGAVTIPFIETNNGDGVQHAAPDGRAVYVMSPYIGTAHAVRRDLFLTLGGYRERLFHFGEEPDFCIRMLDAGYVTRLGAADPVQHLNSPVRDHSRRYVYNTRNGILRAFCNTPSPYLLLHLMAATFNAATFGLRSGHPLLTASGTLRGFFVGLSEIPRRRPVSCATFRLHRELGRRGCVPLSELENRLKPVAQLQVQAR